MPRPILVTNQKPANPADFPWLGTAGVKSLTSDIAQHKAGKLYAFAFAAASNQAWASATQTQASIVSLEEVARRAIEECEYFAHGVPCVLLSLNGNDAHDANGVLPLQPRFLSGIARKFDPARVPFINDGNRDQVSAYARAARPRALIVSLHGYWWWDGGKTVLDAVASDEASCKKHLTTDANDICILYAVNDQVVFAPEYH